MLSLIYCKCTITYKLKALNNYTVINSFTIKIGSNMYSLLKYLIIITNSILMIQLTSKVGKLHKLSM